MKQRVSKVCQKGNIAIIKLRHGREARISLCDVDAVSCHFWRYRAGVVYTIVDGKRVMLHRFVTNAPEEQNVHSRDGNLMNCIRGNLVVGCMP